MRFSRVTLLWLFSSYFAYSASRKLGVHDRVRPQPVARSVLNQDTRFVEFAEGLVQDGEDLVVSPDLTILVANPFA